MVLMILRPVGALLCEKGGLVSASVHIIAAGLLLDGWHC